MVDCKEEVRDSIPIYPHSAHWLSLINIGSGESRVFNQGGSIMPSLCPTKLVESIFLDGLGSCIKMTTSYSAFVNVVHDLRIQIARF